MDGGMREKLAAERPDSVKFMEDEGFVWDPRRTSFVKTWDHGGESVISYERIYEWSLEDLKTLASPFPAHTIQDLKK
jgi:hypothetical protein